MAFSVGTSPWGWLLVPSSRQIEVKMNGQSRVKDTFDHGTESCLEKPTVT
jgi:hypothetical protein